MVPNRQVVVLEGDMENDGPAWLSRLSDAELVARVKNLAARERSAMSELVAHLAELEARGIHFRSGYGSLFAYCREALSLSEHEAYNRIEVARAVRRFPTILEMLAEGSLNLTSVRLLAPHLTAENHRAAFAEARGKRKAQVEEIAARLAPMPDVPAFVRRLPSRPPAVEPAPASPDARVAAASVFSTPAAPFKTIPVLPLAPDRYRFQLTIGGATLEKLRLAKDMLRHSVPWGEDAAILDRALSALLADLARKKFAAVESPRAAPVCAPGSRHIPAEVKRTVFLRDLGRCAFVGESGRRCGERGFVEFHHVKPYAAGGEATVENIQLRCRRHNDYEAKLYFGREGPNDGSGRVREEAEPARSGTSWFTQSQDLCSASGTMVDEVDGAGARRCCANQHRTCRARGSGGPGLLQLHPATRPVAGFSRPGVLDDDLRERDRVGLHHHAIRHDRNARSQPDRGRSGPRRHAADRELEQPGFLDRHLPPVPGRPQDRGLDYLLLRHASPTHPDRRRRATRCGLEGSGEAALQFLEGRGRRLEPAQDHP
jgi:hypothetical protein